MIGIGSSVGHYVVRAKLGEGAMGTVYLAQHHVLDAQVAIKVIRRDAERTEEDVSRFFTEARSASRIGHENIVGVLDFGRTADGDPYYIMEHLTGQSLATRLAGAPLELAEVLHVSTQIADALAASHGKGIVHRDLKPGNVFLVRRGADARFVKLLDFGVAKLTEEEGEDQRGHRTNTGRLLGTPHYMAPEQVAGRRSVDGRADVYALGVLLFELVSGRLPFLAPKWTEVLIQHVTQAPPRVREVVPACPEWLDRLIDRALAKTPQERPSMASMRDALRAQTDRIVEPAVRLLEAHVPSAPPVESRTSAADAPTLPSASDAVLASAETVASPAVRGPVPRPRRVGRTAAVVALALGVGGTALGAVVMGIGGREPAKVVAKVAGDAGPATRYGFGDRIERARHERDVVLDAGVRNAALFDDDAPAEPSALPASPHLRPVPRPDAAVPVVLPDVLDGYDIDKALQATRVGVAACNNRYVGVTALDVVVVVGGDGHVLEVKLDSEFVATPFAWCVQRTIAHDAIFPPFAGAAQDVKYRYGFAPAPRR